MAWESQPNGRSYYYQYRRVDGRVVKTYLGHGLVADLAAEAVRTRRAAGEAARQGLDAERARLAAAAAVAAAHASLVDLLRDAVLVATNHYRCRRTWRYRCPQRRPSKSPSSGPDRTPPSPT